MKKLLLLGFLLAIIQNVFAQNQDTDAALQKIVAEKNDSTRIALINDFFEVTSEINPILDLQNAQKLLQQAQKRKDKISEAMALIWTGYDYMNCGNTEKSLEYDLKGDSIAEETGNRDLIANTKGTLAFNYANQKNYPKAVSLFLSVLQITEDNKNDFIKTWALLNLGDLYLSMNKADSALMYSQRCYELAVQVKSYPFSLLASLFRNLGIIQGKMNNPLLANSYFNMAVREAIKSKSPRGLSSVYTSLAVYFQSGNQNDSAIFYAKKAIDLVEHTAFSNLAIKPAKLLLDIYRGANTDSAFKYSELYRIANDSVYNTKSIQQSQLMFFEGEQRQKEVAVEKIKAEEQRKQNIQYALIAFAIITFIILFLLFSRSIVANEKWISFFGVLGLLVVFEFINLLIHPSLAAVTHESPVLMLLALVAIASLLIPLHHRLEHWIKEKMTEKNKAIRLAAAKKTIEKLEKNNK